MSEPVHDLNDAEDFDYEGKPDGERWPPLGADNRDEEIHETVCYLEARSR